MGHGDVDAMDVCPRRMIVLPAALHRAIEVQRGEKLVGTAPGTRRWRRWSL